MTLLYKSFLESKLRLWKSKVLLALSLALEIIRNPNQRTFEQDQQWQQQAPGLQHQSKISPFPPQKKVKHTLNGYMFSKLIPKEDECSSPQQLPLTLAAVTVLTALHLDLVVLIPKDQVQEIHMTSWTKNKCWSPTTLILTNKASLILFMYLLHRQFYQMNKVGVQ